MHAAETLEAFEAGLITEGEAVEQALVDDLNGLYEATACEPDGRRGSRQDAAERRHHA